MLLLVLPRRLSLTSQQWLGARRRHWQPYHWSMSLVRSRDHIWTALDRSPPLTTCSPPRHRHTDTTVNTITLLQSRYNSRLILVLSLHWCGRLGTSWL